MLPLLQFSEQQHECFECREFFSVKILKQFGTCELVVLISNKSCQKLQNLLNVVLYQWQLGEVRVLEPNMKQHVLKWMQIELQLMINNRYSCQLELCTFWAFTIQQGKKKKWTISAVIDVLLVSKNKQLMIIVIAYKE